MVLTGGAVQNSVKWCKIMENGRTVQNGAKMMEGGAKWLRVVQMA